MLLTAASFFFVSCSKSSNPSSNNNNTNGGNGGAGTNQVLGTVGGTAIVDTGAVGLKTTVAGQYTIGITEPTEGKQIVLAFDNITATGTYDVGTVISILPPTSIGISYHYTDANGNPVSYNSTVTKGTKVGTLTVSSISSTNIQGTFSGTIPMENGPSGTPATISITNGGFNVNLQ